MRRFSVEQASACNGGFSLRPDLRGLKSPLQAEAGSTWRSV
jgi:hypothetical protein